MANPAEIQAKLEKLTRRQCQILYMIWHDNLDYKAIGREMGFAENTIQAEMTQIYKLFDLTGMEREQKRRVLLTQICPVHAVMVSDPEKDCTDRVIEPEPPPPDPKILALVIRDAESGLVPLNKELVRVPGDSNPPSSGGEFYPVPSATRQTRPRRNVFFWVLVGVLVTLCIIIPVFLFQSSIRQEPPANQPTAPIAISTVIVTQPAVVNTQPPLVVTRIVTQPPVLATQPSPTRIGLTLSPTTDATRQDPPPGSIIPAGQGYLKNGVTVTLRKSIDVFTNWIGFYLLINNASGGQLIVRWKNSYVHLKDDKEKVFNQNYQQSADWDKIKQFTIDDGNSRELTDQGPYSNELTLDPFLGSIDPSAKYLIFTIDQLAGMTNMTWRYGLQ